MNRMKKLGKKYFDEDISNFFDLIMTPSLTIGSLINCLYRYKPNEEKLYFFFFYILLKTEKKSIYRYI